MALIIDASMGKVPDPHMGSTKISFFANLTESSKKNARFSLNGAVPIFSLIPLLNRNSPDVSKEISNLSLVTRTWRDWEKLLFLIAVLLNFVQMIFLHLWAIASEWYNLDFLAVTLKSRLQINGKYNSQSISLIFFSSLEKLLALKFEIRISIFDGLLKCRLARYRSSSLPLNFTPPCNN